MKPKVLQNPQTKTRTVYLDYLRVFATFAVIVIHTCADFWSTGTVLSFEWNVLTVYECLVRWCVPIFVMISGVLFLNPEKELNMKTIFTKNIFRLITSYAFWSLSHSLFTSRHDINVLKILSQTIGGVPHLWFIPMIIGIYLILPFLKKISKYKELAIYYIFLFFLFTLLVPQTLTIIYECINIPRLSAVADPFNYVLENSHFFFVAGYSGFFLLGFRLSQTQLTQKQTLIIEVSGFLSVIFTIISTVFFSKKLSKPADFFLEYLTVNVLLESIAVFIFFKHLFQKIKISNRVNSFVAKLSKYSFGIYLCHMLVLKIAKKIGLTAVSFNPIFAIPVTALFVFIVSCIISAVIHKIPVLKKYIV
ncbi:MAG: acyltransferase family protein [Clostridia bacterium]|nr:acyltransferase family protein [Clostridia bacterium]